MTEKPPLIDRPTSQQKEEERKEFDGLFVNLLDDDSDTELLDFVPKKKVLIYIIQKNFCYYKTYFCFIIKETQSKQ